MSKRSAYLQHHEGILTKYRQLQSLQLTELQAKILSAIDPDKIETSSLVDIAKAYDVLTKVQISIQGKDKLRGLVDHLRALENDPIKQ